MSAKRIEITVSEGTWDRLELARGHEPRASFVKRALESALSGLGPGTPVAVSSPRGSGSVEEVAPTESSAPSRAPVRDVMKALDESLSSRPVLPAGVRTARELAEDRQRAMNKAREKKS